MSLRLASDRPIKKRNWICQSHIAATWGRAGRCVCCGGWGQRWLRQEGVPDKRREQENESERESCAVTTFPPCTPPRGARLPLLRCATAVFCCLFVPGPVGGDDMSLFLGISGSEMWL